MLSSNTQDHDSRIGFVPVIPPWARMRDGSVCWTTQGVSAASSAQRQCLYGCALRLRGSGCRLAWLRSVQSALPPAAEIGTTEATDAHDDVYQPVDKASRDAIDRPLAGLATIGRTRPRALAGRPVVKRSHRVGRGHRKLAVHLVVALLRWQVCELRLGGLRGHQAYLSIISGRMTHFRPPVHNLSVRSRTEWRYASCALPAGRVSQAQARGGSRRRYAFTPAA